MFTGLAPSELGIAVSNRQNAPFVATTLAEIAYRAGYSTTAFTGTSWLFPERGLGQGFSHYSAIRQRAKLMFESALGWIEAHGQSPHFMFLHTYEIHSPYTPPKKVAAEFVQSDTDDLPMVFKTGAKARVQSLDERGRRHARDLYDGGIAYTDAALGEFFDELKARGLWDKYLIVLFSDHGEEFWEHGKYGHGVSLYEELIHVPLIIKLPGRGSQPRRVSDLVSLTDLYATVADYMAWRHEPRTN